MAGISNKAAIILENFTRFNGIEFNDNLDIDMYDAFYRNLDPQIGKFWQVDPESESENAFSPYCTMKDNPITFQDPLGDKIINNNKDSYDILKAKYDDEHYKSEKLRRKDFSNNKDFEKYKKLKTDYKLSLIHI